MKTVAGSVELVRDRQPVPVHAVKPVVERDGGETVDGLAAAVTVAELAEYHKAKTP